MTDVPRAAPVVLFLHGLESGPNGSKSRALAEAGFTVVAPPLPSGRSHLLRDPAMVAVCAAAVVSAVLPWLGSTSIALAVGIGALACSLIARVGYAWLIRRRHDACAVAAAAAASRLPPEAAVVGSSNGGGLAVRLLAEGAWAGPTVLLCPAQDKTASLALRRPPRLRELPREVQARVLVVHGDADDIVPVAHSRALTEASLARLEVIPGGDHRLGAHATAPALAAWVSEVRAGWAEAGEGAA